MWFDKRDRNPEHKAVKEEKGERCGKCRGTGHILEIAVGLGNQTLVPAYVETVCPKCRGDGIVTQQEFFEWKGLKEQVQGKRVKGEVPQPPEVIILIDHEFIFPDSFFLEKFFRFFFPKKKVLTK